MWCVLLLVFFFKQKTAYEMRISDWSSDVCSSDLLLPCGGGYEGLAACRLAEVGEGFGPVSNAQPPDKLASLAALSQKREVKSPKPLTDLARTLRQNATEAEQRLWHHLRAGRLEDHKFRRQAPIGRHIADFLCEKSRLIIELDGGQHADQAEADQRRTQSLESSGYTVLRFWNNDVLQNTQGVLEENRQTLQTEARRVGKEGSSTGK